MVTWHTADTARAEWKDAPATDELNDLLATAKIECIEFATSKPYEEFDEPAGGIRPGWRIAQLLQARAIWTFKQTGPQDTIGYEGGGVRVYPMDANIRARLRPLRPVPGVG
ncbi:hypothetical protein EV379_0907 [Microterricola gilva]|uniref:Gp19/Gp15/Gp42-like protein n=1 Tax=Microterricola gilva TaxID=393267 RepID=A0A4Q8AJI7_9MICO|nr:hypothetical protein [Microterricola gilva]RZU64604.1 hypothetical protein EV379_0907 [Microterricola gilva]